ncbi:hypothetical protein Tco_0754174 [Tanacetum coccineum]
MIQHLPFVFKVSLSICPIIESAIVAIEVCREFQTKISSLYTQNLMKRVSEDEDGKNTIRNSALENGIASSSTLYWDTEDDDDCVDVLLGGAFVVDGNVNPAAKANVVETTTFLRDVYVVTRSMELINSIGRKRGGMLMKGCSWYWNKNRKKRKSEIRKMRNEELSKALRFGSQFRYRNFG